MAWSLSQLKSYIFQQAPAYGIDPSVAWNVWSREGANTGVFNGPGGTPGSGWYSTNQNDGGHSLGPFQLYDQGLGATFTRQTGLPISPDTMQQQADFSMQQVASGGWSPWHAAANTGIGAWDGIGTPSGSSPSSLGIASGSAGGNPLAGVMSAIPGGGVMARGLGAATGLLGQGAGLAGGFYLTDPNAVASKAGEAVKTGLGTAATSIHA
jgi:hypothetical protein